MARDLDSHDAQREAGAARRRSDRWAEAATLFLLFLLVFTVYSRSGGAVSMTDTVWTVPIALSLIHEGNLDLDEYDYAYGDGRLRKTSGHWVSFFPVGTPVAVAPLLFVVDRALQMTGNLHLYEHLTSAPDWELVARLNQSLASVLAALTVLVVYLIGRRSLNRPRAFFLALIFAFCTSAWSTASRDLWQHTVSIFAVALCLYLLLSARERPALALFGCGLAAAFAYATRPTNSFLVLFLTIYVLIEYRRQVLIFLAGAAVVALPFLLYNLHFFASPLAPYFQPNRLGDNPQFLAALAGNLVSPARGLLVYSPLLLFAGYGLTLKIRQQQFQRLDAFLAAVIVLHWLAISSFQHWWGGASYGPRFFTDLLPIFAYFLIPAVAQITAPAFWSRWPGRAIGIAFTAALVWSIFVHYRGSTQTAAWTWNGAFLKVVASVDDAPARLWDWSDPQFWRGLRPAAAAVEPQSLCVVGQEGSSEASQPPLTIVNRGDHPFTWAMETPQRVSQQPAYNQVPGLGYGEPLLEVDSAGFGLGDHSLGALYLTARGEDGAPVKNSPLVVPVTLRILPADAQGAEHETAASTSCAAAPLDILVDGRAPAVSEDEVFGIHGPGWYDLETAGETSWRWASTPARLFIFSPQRHMITLTSTPIALHEQQAANGFGERGTLQATVKGQPIDPLAVQVGQPFALALGLQPGWNTVDLELLAGNVRPSDLDPATGDSRLLSFALGPIDIHE